jgi:hypothetical protein
MYALKGYHTDMESTIQNYFLEKKTDIDSFIEELDNFTNTILKLIKDNPSHTVTVWNCLVRAHNLLRRHYLAPDSRRDEDQLPYLSISGLDTALSLYDTIRSSQKQNKINERITYLCKDNVQQFVISYNGEKHIFTHTWSVKGMQEVSVKTECAPLVSGQPVSGRPPAGPACNVSAPPLAH